MEDDLWHLLTGTPGGDTRLRLLEAVDERPRNPNQLAETLGLDYKTVTHHLNAMQDRDIVERSGDSYGAVYRPTAAVVEHWDLVQEIGETMDTDDSVRVGTDAE